MYKIVYIVKKNWIGWINKIIYIFLKIVYVKYIKFIYFCKIVFFEYMKLCTYFEGLNIECTKFNLFVIWNEKYPHIKKLIVLVEHTKLCSLYSNHNMQNVQFLFLSLRLIVYLSTRLLA